MLQVYRNRFRYRCDHCKAMIPRKAEDNIVTLIVDDHLYDRFSGTIEIGEYHFCRISHYRNFLDTRLQISLIKLGDLPSERPF